MTARTTPTLVKAIIEVDSGHDLAPYIEVANGIVTEKLADKHADDRLALIEKWLSAHFYACSNPRLASESIGGVISESYQQKVDLGFHLTSYGQQAMLLDTSGTLAAMNDALLNGKKMKPKMTIKWLGVPKS